MCKNHPSCLSHWEMRHSFPLGQRHAAIRPMPALEGYLPSPTDALCVFESRAAVDECDGEPRFPKHRRAGILKLRAAGPMSGAYSLHALAT